MAGLRAEQGLIYVVGGGQFVNLMSEDRGGEENANLVLTPEEAVALGEMLIAEATK